MLNLFLLIAAMLFQAFTVVWLTVFAVWHWRRAVQLEQRGALAESCREAHRYYTRARGTSVVILGLLLLFAGADLLLSQRI